jgi:hypothetical protein
VCVCVFMAFLCVSQQGEFKNTIKNFFGKIHVKNFWPKKLRKFPQGALKIVFLKAAYIWQR